MLAALRAVMARHDALLTKVFEQHVGGGVRPRGDGDSVLAVSARASDAVAAALVARGRFRRRTVASLGRSR
jgi:hypothetical protein